MSNKSTVKEPKENFSEEDPICHAWYSKKHALMYGDIAYMNENKEEIYVTAVSKKKNYKLENDKWDDTCYVGIVTKFLYEQQTAQQKERCWKIILLKEYHSPLYYYHF